jgi:transposase
MLKDLDILPEDPTELRVLSKILAAEVKSQALLIEKLKHQLAGRNRHRFGSKSENLDQLNLIRPPSPVSRP